MDWWLLVDLKQVLGPMGKVSGEAPEKPWSSVLRVLLLDLFFSLTLQQMPRDYTNLHSWRYWKTDWMKLWATWWGFEASPALGRRLVWVIPRLLPPQLSVILTNDHSYLKHLNWWLSFLVQEQRVYMLVCAFLSKFKGEDRESLRMASFCSDG